MYVCGGIEYMVLQTSLFNNEKGVTLINNHSCDQYSVSHKYMYETN